MKNALQYIIMLLLFAGGFYLAYTGRDNPREIKRTSVILGTIVEVKIRDDDAEKAEDAASRVFEEFRRIDDSFSFYKEGSIIGQINNSSSDSFIVSNEIYSLLIKCSEIWEITNRTFDASIGSLTDLWGFGEGGSPARPSDEDIKKILNRCGWQNIKLLPGGLLHRQNDVQLNLGALAKGYAVDRGIDILKESGIDNALINAGGEIRQIGNDWIIGVRDPDNENGIVQKLKLNGKAAATSGNYEQYFDEGGTRYCHIINPADGYPSMWCKSVTVIADDDMTADALATGIFLMEPAEGIHLAENLADVDVYIIDREGKEYFSSGFGKYILR